MERLDAPEAARMAAVAGELRVVAGRLRQRLRAEAHLGDFTWSQMEALSFLERAGPATVTTLARAQDVRPQSMGETVAVLKAAGLVSGAPDPTDGRQVVLSMTAACREKLRAARAAREDWLFRAIRTTLTPDEQDQLATGVALLKRLIDF